MKMKMISCQGHACQITKATNSCLLHHHIYIYTCDTYMNGVDPLARQVRQLLSNNENDKI